jgi:hypothetical protein
MECRAAQRARALVEQRRRKARDPWLARRVRVGPTKESDLDRDHRHGRVAYEPRLDSARAHHAFDAGRLRRLYPERNNEGGGSERHGGAPADVQERLRHQRVHERLASLLLVSLIR